MKQNPHPVDIHVGSRVRLRRNLLGLSQERLAKALGLTFQQVQKYERGTNRVSASRLYEIGQILDVPIAFFFEDMPAIDDIPSVAAEASAAEEAGLDPTFLSQRESVNLVKAYYQIEDVNLRRSLSDLVKAAAASATGESSDSEAA